MPPRCARRQTVSVSLLPRGTPEERALWADRHPWLAGLYLSVVFNPPMALMFGLNKGLATVVWMLIVFIPSTWIAFAVLLKRRPFRR